MPHFKDLFISYGRRESLSFVAHLHQRLRLSGYDAWFDKVNIPDGEDYSIRIRHGIESAHNFLFVMAPRALCSPYCLIELEYARLLGKRIIPVNQMVIFQTENKPLSEGDCQVLARFYAQHEMPNQGIVSTQQVLDRSLMLIGATDWLDSQESLSDADCQELAQWARCYENYWHRHDDLGYLSGLSLPQFGTRLDSLDSTLERVITVLERHRAHVEQHTRILDQALDWSRSQFAPRYLLREEIRLAAQQWLLTEFKAGEQAPCEPSPVMSAFICASRKAAENATFDVFIAYAQVDKGLRTQVITALSRYGITVWQSEMDIPRGKSYLVAINEGIEKSNNFLYFIAPETATDELCPPALAYAVQHGKRIIPLLIRATDTHLIPEAVRSLQEIEWYGADSPEAGKSLDNLLQVLRHDADYYAQRKRLLVEALRWQANPEQRACLLRGYKLDNAVTWLRLNEQRPQHAPTELHKTFIQASEDAADGQTNTEVFIAYSRYDSSDFARQIYRHLQATGKVIWFDQENLGGDVDILKEIKEGIDSTDNFVFIMSPAAFASEYCAEEIEYATQQAKRFIPLLYRESDSHIQAIPSDCKPIDFINQPFDQAFAELIQAIDLDRDHARQHTIWQQRATEWKEQGQSQEFLLNAIACENAERWMKIALDDQKTPIPTQLQQAFIGHSREKLRQLAKKEKHRMAVLAVLLVLSVIAGINAWFQSIEAKRQEVLARKNSNWATSLTLTSYANQAVHEHTPNAAALLSIAALTRPGAEPDSSYAPTAETLLYESSMVLDDKQLVIQGDGKEGHTSGVNRASYSPDGQHILSASDDKSVRIWNARTGQLEHLLSGHTDEVWRALYSPDGKQIASGSRDKSVHLWDAHSGALLAVLAHEAMINALAYSPDGRFLASGAFDGKIRIWDVQTHTMLRQLEGHQSSINSLQYSADGNRLLSASNDNGVFLWDLDTGNILKKFEGHTDWVLSATFSSDEQQIASSSWDGAVYLWDVNSGAQLTKLSQCDSGARFNKLVYSPDGKYLLAAAANRAITVWDLASRQVQNTVYGHYAAVWSVAFSPDAQSIVSASVDRSIRVWDASSVLNSNIVGRHGDEVWDAVYSPDGKQIASGGWDGKLYLRDSETSETQAVLSLQGGIVRAGQGGIAEISYAPDGQHIAAASYDHNLYIWNLHQPDVAARQLTGHTNAVTSVAYSPDGKQLASASKDKSIRLWNAETGEAQKILTGHTDEVFLIDYDPQGKLLASASRDQLVRLWDIQTGQQVRVLKGHTYYVQTVNFSPDGKRLVSSGQDQSVRVWNVASGEQELVLKEHKDIVYDAIFSPDGRYIVSGSGDKSIIIWNADTGAMRYTLAGHNKQINSLGFSSDGRFLLSGSADRTVRRWLFLPDTESLVAYAKAQLWSDSFSTDARERWQLDRLLGAPQ